MRILTKTLIATTAAIGMTAAANAADLIVRPPVVVAPAPAPAPAGWDGFYIGVHGGYAVGLADHDPITPPDRNDIDLSGLFGGIQAGVNFYLSDSVVGGIEADLSLANITGTIENILTPGLTPVLGLDSTHTINWQGSLRARLGFDAGTVLPYLTAGVAFANAEHISDNNGTVTSDTQTHLGWTVGAGIEVKATEDISLSLEYRYSDFGSRSYDTGAPDVLPITLTTHSIRAGLNFHF